MITLEDLSEECTQEIIDNLSCRGIAMLRGSCDYFYKWMAEDSWWEYFAERYCELYPEQRILKRWVRNQTSALTELKKLYAHIYDVEWDKRSLANANRPRYYIDGEGIRHRYRRRRTSIRAILTPSPPTNLSELVALCVLKELLLKNDEKIRNLERTNNKYYYARVGSQGIWRLWWDHGGNESLHELWAINPLSGKPIRKDSTLYSNLRENGYFD
jgi:hypothetical protein